MDMKRTANEIADFLWSLLTDQSSVSRFSEDPQTFLAEQGQDGLSGVELEQVLDRLADRLPPEQSLNVAPVRSALQTLPPPPAPIAPAVMSAPAPAPAPAPQVIREVTEQRVTHVTEQITHQHHNVTNKFVREGDQITDNRTITEINARGDVTFDQVVTNTTVTATKGGVAVNGSVEGTAINTGRNEGILAGDDVKLEDSIVGNGNTQINDSEVGAFAGRGNATNVEGGNVNMGSGDLLAVDAQGDAQVVSGNANDLRGDVDVSAERVDGPLNLAVGDGNRQEGIEDNSTAVEGSFNTDASVEGSHNSAALGSFNELHESNDTHTTSVSDSFNTSLEDNDVTSLEATQTFEDNSSFTDSGQLTSTDSFEQSSVDIFGDHNDVTLDN